MQPSITPSYLDLVPRVSEAKAQGQTIVLVTGVFDLLHPEHKIFLEKASTLGQVLLVGVESDERVRRLKGAGRPIQSQHQRVLAITELGLATAVFVLPTQFDRPADHESLIAALKPDILAVSEHTAHQPEKSAIMAKFGGVVIVVHEHNKEVSTTQLIQQLAQKKE